MDLFGGPAPQAPAPAAEATPESAAETAEANPSAEREPDISIVEFTEPEGDPDDRPVVEAATEAQLAGEDGAPPEEPASLPGFPEIEGLAVNEGLAWADGDAAAYWKALRHFSDRQSGAAENIRAALEAGNLSDADRAVQALKAASGDIAAIPLHAAAGALARAIHDQSDPAELESLWETVESRLSALLAELRRVLKPREERTSHRHHLPPVNPAKLRKAASLIVPLLVDGDPGAKDCLKDNRTTFRSAFSPDAYQDFEQCVRKGDFGPALESLKKAAKKHGIGL